MKKIIEFSVKYPITILMLIAAVAMLGLISFERLTVDLFPNLNNPRIFVDLKSGELPPAEIERKFVDNIEALIMRQSKVTSVSSVLYIGQALITVEYDWDADMDEAFLDLQKNLSTFSQNSEIDELNISQYNPNGAPVLLIGLEHHEIDDMDVLRRIGANFIRNELIRLEGVAAVEVIGGEEKEVAIEADEQVLEAYNLKLSDVATSIQNSNLDLSGGSIEELGRKYVIKGLGAFKNLDEIKNVVLAYSNNGNSGQAATPIFLGDIAQISYINKKAESIIKINGKRGVALAIYKETQSNTIEASETILQALEVIKKALPGYSFTLISNQAEFVSEAINEVEKSALYGIILAVIILFVFLRRLGTTVIISLAIPISIIATFNLMYFNDLSLNIMTLGGLALGAGMLVDNAIVVMESIFRNIERDIPLKEAIITGTNQVAGAITAATITTIVVFLPIVYLHGAAGELFKDQAWTVAFSLIASLVVAVLVIPMLSSWILKERIKQSESIQFKGYSALLAKILEKRLLVLGTTLLIVIVTIIITINIGSEFIPKGQSDSYTLDIKLPEGTSLTHTSKFVENFEHVLVQICGDTLTQLYVQIGDNPSSESTTTSTNASLKDESNVYFKLDLPKSTFKNPQQFSERIATYLDSFPNIEYSLKPQESSLGITLGTDKSSPLVVEIAGDELVVLKDLVKQSLAAFKNIAALKNLESSVQRGRPQINLVIDRVAAGYSGLTIQQISNQLQELLNGESSGTWDYLGELREINVRYPLLNVFELQNASITNGTSKIPLTELVHFENIYSDRELYRRNQKRIVWISADFDESFSLTEVVKLAEEELQKIIFPPNYSYTITGEEEKRSESFSSLKFALMLSIVLIYMVLASQFESLLHPFTIILTVPLAAVGAILIFFVLGMHLNVMAYIGIIMLMGIAVNDSIILVDSINKHRQQGLDTIPAIIAAGQQRIRPIVMTSLTTILALLPLTIGFGESVALRAPMALAVIGGLISSTSLSLVVIPCIYYYVERLRRV